MNLDAYNDMARQENVGITNATPEYIPGYDPDQDPWYDVGNKPHYSADLYLASQNYWAGKTGQQSPPPPDYRRYKGRMRLGRYLDVYGCQAHMRGSRHNWQTKRWAVIIGMGALLAVGVEFGILDLLALPILLVLWAVTKVFYAMQYGRYYDAQKAILQTGQPVWLPYERKRLRWIKRNAFYVWP
jgi:hypothetical protein